MRALDRRQGEFVALGAALASNCIPCMEYHIAEARRVGISAAQIREAVEVADTVRKVPAEQVLGTARALLEGTVSEQANRDVKRERGCGCG